MECLTDLMNKFGLSKEEFIKYSIFVESLVHQDDLGHKYKDEIKMGVLRDIQAQRLPANIKVPPRREVFNYLSRIKEVTGSNYLALLSFLSPGSWTSSGGSFKLARDSGIDLEKILIQRLASQEDVSFLEIGAGYAGSQLDNDGVFGLKNSSNLEVGKNTHLYFTNLTNWFETEDLPDGIEEKPGILARNIGILEGEIPKLDLVYSQCATYFEPNVFGFLGGLSQMLKLGGQAVFNVQNANAEIIEKRALNFGLKIIDEIIPGNTDNGILYHLEKEFD